MGLAVLHIQKCKKPTGNLGNHIDRVEGKEYSYRHANPELKEENIFIQVNKYCKMGYNEAIAERIKEGYNVRMKNGELRPLRKDAVHSCNVILSGSHRDIMQLRMREERFKEWIQDNLHWCKETFGAQNITRFAVHMDEKTPHIHCVFVPITEEGKLTANEWCGNGKKLEALQTDYARAMEKYGLERGTKSDRKHHTTEEYRRRESRKLKTVESIKKEIDALKPLNFALKSNKIKEDLKTDIENFALRDESVDLKRVRGERDRFAKLNLEKKRKLEELEENYKALEEMKNTYEKRGLLQQQVKNLEKELQRANQKLGEVHTNMEHERKQAFEQGQYDILRNPVKYTEMRNQLLKEAQEEARKKVEKETLKEQKYRGVRR